MKSLTETILNRNVNQYTWRRPWTRYSNSHSHSSSNRRSMACVHFLRGAKYISLAPDKIPTAGSIKITIANSQKSSWQKVWIISHIRQVSQVSQEVFHKSATGVGGPKTFGRTKKLENQKIYELRGPSNLEDKQGALRLPTTYGNQFLSSHPSVRPTKLYEDDLLIEDLI